MQDNKLNSAQKGTVSRLFYSGFKTWAIIRDTGYDAQAVRDYCRRLIGKRNTAVKKEREAQKDSQLAASADLEPSPCSGSNPNVEVDEELDHSRERLRRDGVAYMKMNPPPKWWWGTLEGWQHHIKCIYGDVL